MTVQDHVHTNIQRLRAYSSQSSLDLWTSVKHRSRAAVLVLLYVNGHDDLCAVVTVRSIKLRTYPGQAAFPGGRCDSDTETPWETALREAHEEIGFDAGKFSSEFHRLCTLPVYSSANRLLVLPCVGYLEQAGIPLKSIAPKLSEHEVSAVYGIQLNRLFTELHYDSQELQKYNEVWYNHIFRIMTDEIGVEWTPLDKTVPRMPSTDIVGLTANILLDCCRIAFSKDPETFDFVQQIGYEDRIRRNLRSMGLEFRDDYREDGV